jgi:hypothetical protein
MSGPPNMVTATQINRPDVVNGLCLHLSPGGSENPVDLPPSYRTRPSSLEHPRDITVSDGEIRRLHSSVIHMRSSLFSTTFSDLGVFVLTLVQEILPNYQPTRSSWSTTPCVESQLCEYLSDETPHRRPAQAIGTQFSSMGREERPFQHRAGARSSIFKQDDIDSQASGSTVSESFTSYSTRPLSNTHESSPGNYIVSPVPSLCRARVRALTITGTSGFSRLGGTEEDGNPSIRGDRRSNGADRRNFRSYGSPFSQRVKEKLREAHVKS